MVFDEVINSINLKVSGEDRELLFLYSEIVIEYNKNVNITGSKDSDDFLVKHILDSIIAYKYFSNSKNILDVGCGAGVPSIPLAIMYKDKNFTLCESKNKKAEFLRLAKEKLNIQNIKVECKNVYEIKDKFDTITARAFSDMKTLLKIYSSLKTKDGILLAYKGRLEKINEELEMCRDIKNYNIEINPLKADFLNSQRHIVKIY